MFHFAKDINNADKNFYCTDQCYCAVVKLMYNFVDCYTVSVKVVISAINNYIEAYFKIFSMNIETEFARREK
jgi:hypothetical protein